MSHPSPCVVHQLGATLTQLLEQGIWTLLSRGLWTHILRTQPSSLLWGWTSRLIYKPPSLSANTPSHHSIIISWLFGPLLHYINGLQNWMINRRTGQGSLLSCYFFFTGLPGPTLDLQNLYLWGRCLGIIFYKVLRWPVVISQEWGGPL